MHFSWPTSSNAIFPRNLWLALLLAPVGAIARWKLSALNGTLRGRWSWFFLGTFTANMLACALNGVCKALTAGGDASFALAVATSGWGTGLDGCLSTVSTWVSEIRKLTPKLPGELSVEPALYAFGSQLCGLAIFCIVYGPAHAYAA